MQDRWQKCRERNATERRGKGIGQTQTSEEANKVVVCEDDGKLNEDVNQDENVKQM